MDGDAPRHRSDPGVAVCHRSPGTLVVGLQTNAAQGRGIWRTTDLGDTWLPSSGTGATATSRALCDLGAEVLAGFYNTSPRGVFRSTDGGAWALSSNGIATSTIINEIYDDAGTIWAGAWEALYRSTDNGFHWQTSGGIGRAQSILRVGNRLLVGTDAGIQSTTDGGETWSSFSTGLPGSIVETMASVQGTAFAAIWGFGIYRLEGETWVPTSIDDDYYEVLQSVGPVLVTQSVLGYDILYSLDLGETWSTFNDGFFGGEIYTMTISDGHLVAGTRGRGFWARPLSDLPGAADVPSPEPSTAANEMHLQLWPNPTKDGGTFAFALPQAGRVRLTLYDVSGRALLVLADERMSAGEHRARMESGDLSRLPAAGAVFARLELDGTVLATTKLARLP
ncbi:MAG: hypothetical protein R3E12_02875 [Candidatus Eisenbacteria bacterium]